MGLLLLVALAFFLLREDSRGLESDAGESQVTARSESLELAPAAAPSGQDRVAALEGREVDGSTPSATSGRSLRGTLRFSSDSRPAAGEKLSFFHGRDEEMTQVLTDSGGHFVTEAVVRPGVVRMWHVRLDEEGRGAGLALEPQFCLVPEEGDAPVELDLLLREAEARLRALVLSDGVPCAATIHSSGAVWGPIGEAGLDGRAEIALALKSGQELAVSARTPGRISREHELRHPWPDELIVLELEPWGSVRAWVRDPAGKPLAGRLVTALDRTGTTNHAGLASIRWLPCGRPLQVWMRGGAEQTVTLSEGGEVEVSFVALADELVAAGTILDEAGEPLGGIDVQAESERGYAFYRSTRSGEDGSFELRAEVGLAPEFLRVGCEVGVFLQAFEPAAVLVQRGTRGLRFQGLEIPEELPLSIVVLGADTHAPPADAQVVFFRAGAPEDFDSYHARDGVVRESILAHEDLRILARAVGYLERRVAVSELSEPVRRGEAPLVLELERGFELELLVLEDETGEPLVARLFADGEPLATTDAEGRARLRLPGWPALLRVEADGHEPEDFSEWM
ncbi:MAG: carboxypeptidase-like regulatory domain-containing protein, partial [Planctomycetota bacterium]